MNDQELKDFINDPKQGFVSADKIYRKLNGEVSRKRIDDIMGNKQNYQVNKERRKEYFSSIRASNLGNIQIDLMDVSRTSTVNNDIHFLLTFIDIYSRYVMVEPIKEKSAETVRNALKKLIEGFKHPIKTITSDEGSEFVNNKINKVLESHEIKHFITPANTPNKLSLVERFHRTLWNRINLFCDHNRSKRYIDELQNLITNYNNTYHSTIKTEPINIYNKVENNNQVYVDAKMTLKVGDKVRRAMTKTKFDKGTQKFSDAVYTVCMVHNFSYSIMDKNNTELPRKYLGYELRKIDSIDNEEEYDQEINQIAKKKRLQKSDPAFNDKNTHKVDDYGEATTAKHWKPERSKREVKPRKVLDI